MYLATYAQDAGRHECEVSVIKQNWDMSINFHKTPHY